jgi:hypothetical protein
MRARLRASSCRSQLIGGLADRGAIFRDILDLCARVLAIQPAKERGLKSPSDPQTWFCPLLVGARRGPVLPAVVLSAAAARVPSLERWAAGGQAAALSDGHVSQDADRLASTRAWRAAAGP